MGFVFLGWGKVTQALAQVCAGPKLALVELSDSVEILEISEDGLHAILREKISGSFETVDWRKHSSFKIFLSPGIDPRRPFFRFVKSQEVRELDYFTEHFKGWVIGITGTDGKSTFTTQLGEVLKRALRSQRIFVGGNLGQAMALALKDSYDGAVLEVSSFQAERLRSTQLKVGILLNLANDHADRYDSFDDYAFQKWELLRHSENFAAPKDLAALSVLRGKRLNASYTNESRLDDILKGLAPEILKCISENSVTWDPKWLVDLPMLPHRLEIWQSKEGVGIVNDSKATTVHASLYGYEEMKQKFPRIFLILGGKYKGDDFSRLAQVRRPQDSFLLVGEARHEIETQMLRSEYRHFRSYETLALAVKEVLPTLGKGDCLMLSPACSSYDEFKNFEERGERFKDWAQEILGELSRPSDFS